MSDSGAGAPAHFRSLGRSAFLAAALDADKKLDKVARSFDFLLSVSPINSREAMERFFAGGEEEAPKFRYRPLTVDPDAAKRDLYAVDLSIIEDPLLERLLSEKRQEIDHQLTMLSTRNTAAFKAASLLHYGDRRIAAAGRRACDPRTAARPASRRGDMVGALEVAEAARALVGQYRAVDKRFDAAIEVRDDVGGLLVSGRKLMIASNTAMLRSRVDALLSHESQRPPAHLLQRRRPRPHRVPHRPCQLRRRSGGARRVRRMGGRRACPRPGCACSRGASSRSTRCSTAPAFIDVYRGLADGHGLPRKPAFDIATRVFRSGGFAKDLIYLKGFQAVIGLVGGGRFARSRSGSARSPAIMSSHRRADPAQADSAAFVQTRVSATRRRRKPDRPASRQVIARPRFSMRSD